MNAEVKKVNDETLAKIIKSVTLVATCAYEVYKIWSSENVAKGANE